MKIKIARDLTVELEELARQVHDAPNEFARFLLDQPNDLYWLGTAGAQPLRESVVNQVRRYLPARRGEVNAEIVGITAQIQRLEIELQNARALQAAKNDLKTVLDFFASQLPSP